VSEHRIGVIAGAFNPVTRAHIALADAARSQVDEIVFAMPRTLPHKDYHGASLEHRIEMLRLATSYSVEITNGGLYIDIAREIRAARGSHPNDILLICGRDAAERIIDWKYDHPGTLEEMFREFQLLVANRQGVYDPPAHLHSRIHSIELPGDYEDVSSSDVRRRVAAGEPWEHLVPESIADRVREIYSADSA
jgi:nicotinate-nucleotide adenylyltransferase